MKKENWKLKWLGDRSKDVGNMSLAGVSLQAIMSGELILSVVAIVLYLYFQMWSFVFLTIAHDREGDESENSE
jgi:hypothetical protein